MEIKIPKGLDKEKSIIKHFEKGDLKSAYSHANRGINVPIDYRRETPTFAAIALFNGDQRMYELFIKSMHKHVGKYGAAKIMKIAVENDMGIEVVEEMWNDRNVQVSYNFISALKECDEKYIRFFLGTDKLLSRAKKEFADISVRAWIRMNGMRLLKIGFEFPKFANLFNKLYEETGDELFLSEEAKEMFLF